MSNKVKMQRARPGVTLDNDTYMSKDSGIFDSSAWKKKSHRPSRAL